MSLLREIAAYLWKAHPDRKSLTVQKFSELIYLADWLSALKSGSQLTDATWKVSSDNLPHAESVTELLEDSSEFRHSRGWLLPAREPYLVLQADPASSSLSEDQIDVLRRVVETSTHKDTVELRRLVRSTYPVLTSHKGSMLDLVRLASEYQHEASEVTA